MKQMNLNQAQYAFFSVLVEGAYHQQHRAYHNIRHIQDIFYMAEEMKLELSDDQKLAIFFHDAVYVPGAPNNEENSVLLLKTIIAQNESFFHSSWPTANVPLIESIIMDTKSHNASSTAAMIVLDLDMAILGADSERYVQYMGEVRREFAMFSDEDYSKGRSHFLDSLVGNHLFNTKEFQDRFYDQAQANILIELATLSN